MTAPAKIGRLMSVLATGFVLSCRAGEAGDKRRAIRVKKHGRPAQFIPVGLDRLLSVLFKEMRLLGVLGGEAMGLLAVKGERDEGFFCRVRSYSTIERRAKPYFGHA